MLLNGEFKDSWDTVFIFKCLLIRMYMVISVTKDTVQFRDGGPNQGFTVCDVAKLSFYECK